MTLKDYLETHKCSVFKTTFLDKDAYFSGKTLMCRIENVEEKSKNARVGNQMDKEYLKEKVIILSETGEILILIEDTAYSTEIFMDDNSLDL